jgi:histone H3/H4
MFKNFDEAFIEKVLNQYQQKLQSKAYNLQDYLAQKEILQISENLGSCGAQEKRETISIKGIKRYKAFLIVPTPSAASTALHNTFAEQKKVYVPWKGEVDYAIVKNKPLYLLKKLFQNSLIGNKNVIVQHGHVAETGSHVDCLPVLKKTCRRDGFLHSVRSPIDCFLSAINNEIIQKCGAGYFPSMIDNSAFSHDLFENNESAKVKKK